MTQIAGSPLTHRFSVLDRAGTIHLDETLEHLPARAAHAHDTHAALFHRELTTTELDTLVHDVQRLFDAHHARTWNTPAATQSWERVSQALHQLEAADPRLPDLYTQISHSPQAPLNPDLDRRNAFHAARTTQQLQPPPGQPRSTAPRYGPTP